MSSILSVPASLDSESDHPSGSPEEFDESVSIPRSTKQWCSPLTIRRLDRRVFVWRSISFLYIAASFWAAAIDDWRKYLEKVYNLTLDSTDAMATGPCYRALIQSLILRVFE